MLTESEGNKHTMARESIVSVHTICLPRYAFDKEYDLFKQYRPKLNRPFPKAVNCWNTASGCTGFQEDHSKWVVLAMSCRDISIRIFGRSHFGRC